MANEGLSRTPEYISWNAMRRRCLRFHDQAYYRYGGRGITICERWLGEEGFANFLTDMGPRPEGYQLDRIDNDGNYEPDNCRWVTRSQNQRNKNPWIAVDTKLREESVKEIKQLLKEGNMMQKDIAEMFGVSRAQITQIKQGKRWGWVE